MRLGLSRQGGGRRWWVELAVVVVLYQLYGVVRGAVEGGRDEALAHARDVIAVERALGLFVERSIQEAFLPWVRAVQAWNVYYGSIHFVVPVATFVVLWRWRRWRYWYARDAFLVLLGLGIVGFVVYPLMPPRFVPELEIIDTAARLGPWAEDPEDAANLYAAMPSLHIGWAAWCTFALWPVVRRWFGRTLLVGYPFLTLAATVITGNHYWLDGVGGVAALAVAIGLVRLARTLGARVRIGRTPAPAPATRRPRARAAQAAGTAESEPRAPSAPSGP